MQDTLVWYVLQQSVVVVVVLGIAWYMTKYFMVEMAKKDSQNQDNLKMFIWLVEKSNDVMWKFSWSLDWLHPKLNDMHEDIKTIRDRK